MGVIFSSIGGALVGYYANNIVMGLLFFGMSVLGYLSGYFISPDLDQIGITSDEGRMMQSLSIFGVLLVMLFMPYSFLMRFIGIKKKGHRNFFSHTPVIGTLIRLIWLLFPFYFVVKAYFPTISITIWHTISFGGLLWGMSFSDMVHFIMDLVIPKQSVKRSRYVGKKRNDVGRLGRQEKYGTKNTGGGSTIQTKIRKGTYGRSSTIRIIGDRYSR